MYLCKICTVQLTKLPSNKFKLCATHNKEYHQKWRRKNAKSVTYSQKNYRKNHKRKLYEKNNIQYQRYKKAGMVSKETRKYIFERQCSICNLCKKKTKLTVDHIIPVSKGGTSELSNLQGLCITCNIKKSDIVL